ncbi:hypothetical protein TcasGA2_TC010690 [Tribolium castaneum]|uniref:Tyr recombinase domain-containing protein n=1 Tax=Tribolium castaneum TaxID=7070 RepID=D2CG43_TRICA|nr:hypothetical protein TcasGA2_TC010690 [Tribolium castaneum]
MGTSNDPIGADILARMEKLEQKLKTRRKTKRRHHRSRSPSPFSSSRGDQDRTCKRRCRRSESIEVLTSSVDDPQRPVLETATSDPLPFLVEAPLDPEILLLLGAPQNSEEPLGEPIHASIAERWPVVIQKGLDPEITQQLLKKYPVGPNCTFAKTPRVNPEISASLTDSVLERDLRLSNKQLQMSACLAAMGKVLSLLLKNEQPDGTSFIEALSDSGRLLCDLFYQDSLLRRTLILELLANPQITRKLTLKSRRLKSETEWQLSDFAYSDIIKRFGYPEIDLFANRHNAKCEKFVAWLRDPGALAIDAFTVSWEDYYFYAFPPFSVVLRTLRKIISDRPCGILVVPNWPIQPWFPLFISLLTNKPFYCKPSKYLLTSPDRRRHPIWNQLSLVVGRLSGKVSTKKDFMTKDKKGIHASNIMISSIAPSTLKQYSSSLKRWWSFCHQNRIDIYTFNVTKILDFLTELFSSGSNYGTINSARSALALLISPEVGTDFRIKRFFKGVENLRPGRPRYEITWDPHIVLKYLSSRDNKSIPLDILGKKLAMLLALTTAHRVQTLSLIDIRNIDVTSDKTLIKIPDRIKTSKRTRPQPVLLLPYFKERPQVCVATTLQVYMEKTKTLRGSCTRLFISPRGPNGAASTQTLSRWIKQVLKESGIDTTMFSAHSTRHASTSKADHTGISLDVIRKTAGWSSNSKTFAVFYKRPLQNNQSFAKAIYS